MVIIEKWQLVTSYFVAARGGGGENGPIGSNFCSVFFEFLFFYNKNGLFFHFFFFDAGGGGG